MGAVPAATMVNQGDVRRVRVGVNSTEPLITRVVIDLAKKIPYTIETVGEELRVLFARAAEAAASLVTPAEMARPEPVAAAPATSVAEPASVAVPATTTTATAQEPSAANMLAAAQAPAPTVLSGQAVPAEPEQPRFSGHPVTFDFQGADLRAVLRTFAEISGLNVVIDPTIQGTVDVSLREVPWDQALDIILKANKLGYAVDGTIVRIAPLAILAQENEERRKLTEAQALAGELRVMTRPLSYAKAADLVPIITKSALSQRGDADRPADQHAHHS
jgi:type IV pilus assembly protein PilQ